MTTANMSVKLLSYAETTILEESAIDINSILSANVGRSKATIPKGKFCILYLCFVFGNTELHIVSKHR